MEKLKPIEDKLADLFKGLPAMPDNAKKSLASAMEWIALVFGVLQLFAVWGLWNAGHRANEAIDYLNRFSNAFGGGDVAPKLGVVYYISLLVLAVSALTLLLAYPGLKAGKKAGWNWLFLGLLVNIAYGVLSVFVNSTYGGGADNLVFSLLGSFIGFYLLFQIRGQYVGSHKSAVVHHDVTPKSDK